MDEYMDENKDFKKWLDSPEGKWLSRRGFRSSTEMIASLELAFQAGVNVFSKIEEKIERKEEVLIDHKTGRYA